MVPSYAPSTAYSIFMRALFNRDIATGTVLLHDELATEGPSDTWHVRNIPPELPEPVCNVYAPGSCEPDVYEAVRNGTAIVEDFVVVGVEGEGGRWTARKQQGLGAAGQHIVLDL